MTATASTEEDLALRSTAAELAKRCREVGETDGHAGCLRRLTESGFWELRAFDGEGPAATCTQTVAVVEELAASVCESPFVGPLLAHELARLAGVAAPAHSSLALAGDLESVGVDLVWDAGSPTASGLGLSAGDLVSVDLGSVEPTQDLSRMVARGASSRPIGPAAQDVEPRFAAFARIALAADTLGVARAILEEAVAYAHQRVQFGAPIGSFQAVQHLCARAYGEVEALRSAVLYASWALDAGDDYEEPALVAKSYAASAGVSIVEKAIQVFGGIAITWEFPAHRHLRRALMNAEVLGGREASALALLTKIEEAEDGVQ